MLKSFFEEIIDSANYSKQIVKGYPNDRYYSWEYCYMRFYKALKGIKDYDDDYLAMNLAFYLASWGMYRGSAFLLQRDYTVHKKAVCIIRDYSDLLGMDSLTYDKKVEDCLSEAVDKLVECYSEVKESVSQQQGEDTDENLPTDTLLSKVLLGTLGCVPAFDRYVKRAIRDNKKEIGCNNDRFFGSKSEKTTLSKTPTSLITFYRDGKNDKIESNAVDDSSSLVIKDMEYDIPYPDMKILDMGLWMIGLEEEQILGLWDKIDINAEKDKIDHMVLKTYRYIFDKSRYDSCRHKKKIIQVEIDKKKDLLNNRSVNMLYNILIQESSGDMPGIAEFMNEIRQ